MKEIELIGKRKAREKHFLKQNGVIEAQVFDEDIHFLKNGIYEEIDNTLIDKGDYYTNKNNAYEVKLYKDTSDNLMEVSIDDKFIKTRLLNPNLSELTENIMESKTHKNVCYSNILDNIDLEYNVLPTKVKEAIILKNKNVCIEKLVFSIETNMKLSLLENKKIIAEKDDVQIFEFDAPYMIDKEFKTNNKISYELIEYEDKYLLKIKIDEEWLQDENTKYPVMIDPTISNSGQNNSVYDTYIANTSMYEKENFGSEEILNVGLWKIDENDYTVSRSLLKFDLPLIGTGSQIIDAQLNLIGYPVEGNSMLSQIVNVHRLTCDWDEGTATWNTMHDKYDSKVEACIHSVRSGLDEDGTINPVISSANLTRLVKKWYTGTPNYGIMLKLNEEIYEDIRPIFFSKNNKVSGGNPKPVLVISYRNQNGIEDYMDYQEQNFSNGTAYVNKYNGNLTTIFDIGSTIGSNTSINLNLVYNTNDVVLNNDFGYGLGFKLNLHQMIKEQIIDGKTYLEYCDEDGTLHYFLNQKTSFDENGYNTINTENVYYDEDGLDLTITKNNDNYILKDKKGNIMKFSKHGIIAYLTEIEEVNGAKNTIEYNSENIITKIIDTNGEEIKINLDNNNLCIISPSETVILSYLNNQIIRINDINGITEFEYNDKKILSKITDTSGIKIKYEYYNQEPYKVKRVSEYGIENTLGEYFDILYGFDSTTITDSEGNAQNITFNSQGAIASISGLKEKDDIANAYGISQINGTTANLNLGYNNKLLKSKIPIKYVNNLLNNSSFETNDIKFTSSEGADLIISHEEYMTGTNSLKVVNAEKNQYIIENVNVKKGDYYTFSAYIKNSNKVRLSLGYVDENYDTVEEVGEIIGNNDKFERHDLTIYYPENSTSLLFIKIYFDEVGITYVDDVQLEIGEVANNYNLIENSDFSAGFSDWTLNAWNTDTGNNIPTNDKIEVVSLKDNVKALKIKKNPSYSLTMSKKFDINGKGGDVYNISFWYKNEGIISDFSLDYGSRVFIGFNYIDQDDGQCELSSPELNINDELWQFSSNEFIAKKDYSSIVISFSHIDDANDIYITNLSLYKDIRSVSYEYDDFGNVILSSNLNNKVDNFNYDKNNQLIQMTNPKGKNFAFEYDNVITDRVINGISDMGISNQAKYDKNNNPVLTKVMKNNLFGEMNDGLYKIRLKGTNNYLRNVSNQIKIDECDSDLWSLERNGSAFKIHHSIVIDKYFTIENNRLVLSDYNEDNSLFELVKNKNGSYLVKSKKDNKYLKYSGLGIESVTLEENDYNFEFYFETIDLNLFIENGAKYTNDGKFIKNTNDLFGEINYDIDTTTGMLKSEKDANGNITNYCYNNKKQLTEVSNSDKKVIYEYNDSNLLSKIKNGTMEYNYLYNEFNDIKKIKIGDNINLIDFFYKNGNLTSYKYGNGSVIKGTYDNFGRIEKVEKEDQTYYYKYDSNGDLSKIISENDIIKFDYDFSKRLCIYKSNKLEARYIYDANENILSVSHKLEDINNKIMYTYSDDDYVTSTSFDDNKIIYEYDGLGRIISENINNQYPTNYSYVTNGRATSYLVNSISNNGDEYNYKYDKLKNITHIYHNGKLENKYKYDDNNQLIYEKNYMLNNIIKYKYDNNGNILSKSNYDIKNYNLISKMTYEYDNENWSDQLTKINEKTIIYDDIGNPIQIGSNIHLNWINGRELKEYNDGINQIKYKYNISGVRTEKIINNDKTSYFIEGSNIVFEKNGKNMLYYIRSNMDDLLGFKYNDRTYYYVKNIHDDIIAILNSSNQIVAKYQYDSWGNILSITDSQGNDISADINHIANINPYRYRSYYYDKEIKMYYLNDRYYNPLIGRFINPDITTGEVGGNIIGHNMYQYAFNNSINFDDSNGDWPKWLKKSIKKIAIGAAVIAVGVIITAATGGAALPALGAGITAALVTGAIAGTIRAATSLIKSNRSKNNTSSTKRKSNTKKSSGSSSTLKETGKSFVEGFADGFMYGGILAGSAQMISGCFKISTNLGVVGGKNSGINISNNIKVLSPNAGFHTKNIGGTIIKFGENVRLDVGSSSLFHTHGFGIDHLPFGIFSSGLYGGLKK